jgi:hypothetical protein
MGVGELANAVKHPFLRFRVGGGTKAFDERQVELSR